MRPILKDVDLQMPTYDDNGSSATILDDSNDTWPRTPIAEPSYPQVFKAAEQVDMYDDESDEEPTMVDGIPFPLTTPKGGFKFDQGKTRMELLPFDALVSVAKVLTYGLAKGYPPTSWRQVVRAKSRYLGALLRHICARIGGEYLDPESGLPHTAHIACNAMFLCSLDAEGEFLEL